MRAEWVRFQLEKRRAARVGAAPSIFAHEQETGHPEEWPVFDRPCSNQPQKMIFALISMVRLPGFDVFVPKIGEFIVATGLAKL